MRAKHLFLLFLLLPLATAFEAHMVNISGNYTNLTYGLYSNITSYSYKEPGIWNPNIYIALCNTTLNGTYYLDLRYATESGNLSTSVLVFTPEVNISGLNNSCRLFDIDTSAFTAIFPARPFIYLLEKIVNTTNVTVPVTVNNSTTYVNKTVVNVTYKPVLIYKLNETFNGSYKLGITFDNVKKGLYVSVNSIIIGNNISLENPPDAKLLFISIVRNGTSVAETVESPGASSFINYTIQDEEEFYVNGILSLKVKAFHPCGVVNESGYYVLNDSAWNVNESCIIVENVTNVVINFANNTVDGEENETLATDVCGVVIRKAQNVTLYDARVQSFKRNICVIDSKFVNIIGTYSSNALESVFLENSTATIASISLDSRGLELNATDSLVNLQKVKLPEETVVSLTGENIGITDVPHPPPDREGYININQFLNVSKVKLGAWAYRITFHYTYPLPNNATHVVYITKVDGVYVNGTWVNLTYQDFTANKQDFTDQNGKLAYGYAWIDLNITNFSIFIPYALNITAPVPKPVPEPVPVPQPTPVPTEVPGPQEKAIPPKVNLTLLVKNITLQQGETGEIPFKITNEGKIDVFDIYVKPDVRYGWKDGPRYFEVLRINQTKEGRFYITVYDNEKPGVYYIPIRAMLGPNNVTVDAEILKVIVLPRQRVAKIDILEILPYLVLPDRTKVPISVLVKNTGDYNLTNLTLRIEGAEDCLYKIDGSYSLKVGEEKSLTYTLYTKEAGKTCKGVYVFDSDHGVVAIYPVIIKIRAVTPLKRARIFLMIYVLWTMLTVHAIYRYRRRMKRRMLYGG